MILPSFRLDDKVVLVTGSGRGIGKALARGMAEAGARVALAARTEAELLQTKGVLAEETGTEALTVAADLTRPGEPAAVVNRVLEHFGACHILVNNAGGNIRLPSLEMTDEQWTEVMDLNLKAAFSMAREAGKHMSATGGGKIINIASVAGQVAIRTGVAYAASKAGLIQMTKALAVEWGHYNINVNAIAPWYFRTPLTEPVLGQKEYLERVLARTPLQRVGELPNLAGVAVFLASEAADYITGQTISVDGGMTVFGF